MKLIWETSPLVLGDVLVGFVNRFIPDAKYFVEDCENLQVHIQMQLSRKRKRVSEFFVTCLESTSNFKHFEKEDDRHS